MAPIKKKTIPKFIFYMLFMFYCFQDNKGQEKHDENRFDSCKMTQNIDTLRLAYGVNKEIPKGYELSALLALSFYPELKDADIRFIEKPIRTTLNARPTLVSVIFRKKGNRKYKIRVNSNHLDSTIHLDDVPFNARIGLYGHEYSHLVDYMDCNFFGMMNRLLAYTSKKKKERFEKRIDKITIDHGLGWQLYYWSNYVINKSDAAADYIIFKKNIYLEPSEIIEIMN